MEDEQIIIEELERRGKPYIVTWRNIVKRTFYELEPVLKLVSLTILGTLAYGSWQIAEMLAEAVHLLRIISKK